MQDMKAASARFTILVIEDDRMERDMYVRKLGAEGFSVLQAEDGVKGIEMALEQEPSIILLDICMPQMSGFEMLKRLREKNTWGAHVPVIFLTNLEPEDDAQSADIESTEPAQYLIKSNTSLEQLIEKVREALGMAR